MKKVLLLLVTMLSYNDGNASDVAQNAAQYEEKRSVVLDKLNKVESIIREMSAKGLLPSDECWQLVKDIQDHGVGGGLSMITERDKRALSELWLKLFSGDVLEECIANRLGINWGSFGKIAKAVNEFLDARDELLKEHDREELFCDGSKMCGVMQDLTSKLREMHEIMTMCEKWEEFEKKFDKRVYRKSEGSIPTYYTCISIPLKKKRCGFGCDEVCGLQTIKVVEICNPNSDARLQIYRRLKNLFKEQCARCRVI